MRDHGEIPNYFNMDANERREYHAKEDIVYDELFPVIVDYGDYDIPDDAEDDVLPEWFSAVLIKPISSAILNSIIGLTDKERQYVKEHEPT